MAEYCAKLNGTPVQNFPEMHVHHKNGIKSDNRPENLMYLTQSDHYHITTYFATIDKLQLIDPDIVRKVGITLPQTKFTPLEEDHD